jgi:predicted Zn-dependent protease
MSVGIVEDAKPKAGGLATLRLVLLLAAVAMSLAVLGCASIDAPPVPAHVTPTAAKEPASAPPSPERRRLMQAFGGEYHAPTTENYLNGILLKLTPTSSGSPQPYRVTLLNSPVVNAFALPSGDIFVTRGLLALAEDTSEVAAVMAHEIAHVTARHAAQRSEFEKTAALFTRVNAQVLQHAQADDEVQARSKLSIASFSRQQEFEADQIGIRDLGKAGYDPYAAARFLTALGKWSALSASISGTGSNDRPDMMATHPSTPERVAQAEAEARQIRPPGAGERGRDAYLTAIDGLAFGDDPSQGVVRGTTFIHPKLGFAFEAPEGFTLDNQSAALIGVGEAGSQALRLDSVAITDTEPVTSAIASGWIDGLKTTDVEPMRIGGLEAATAVAKGEQWSFRLGAVRLNSRLYRLIFAAHSLAPAVDERFRASLQSFRLINARDSALAAAQSIKIVTAGSVDTPETMAARMAFVPQPLDQFVILNGLVRGAPLSPGQAYKIVAR